MDLNIYAGPLTQYYAGNWTVPDGGGCEPAEMTAAEIQEAAEDWQADLVRALTGDDGGPEFIWDEAADGPYFAWPLSWECFEALRLYAASGIYGGNRPDEFPAGGALDDFPVFESVRDDEEMNWSIFIGTLLWLPIEEEFSFKSQLPTGQEATISTAGSLLCELGQVNDLSWKEAEENLIEWVHTEGPAAGNRQTESMAKYAFSVLYRAALYALDHEVPVILDY